MTSMETIYVTPTEEDQAEHLYGNKAAQRCNLGYLYTELDMQSQVHKIK